MKGILLQSPQENFGFIMKTALALLVFGWLLGSVSASLAADNDRLSRPRSHLGASPDSPVFLGLYGQVGSAFEYDAGLPGGGAFILFRPGAAADFFNFLYHWNTGFILQADYLPVADDDRYILSADGVFRKYFQDMREPDASGSTFLGLGIGASKVQLSTSTRQKYWSWLAEAGHEWTLRDKYVFWIKAQYRHYSHGGYNYSNLTVQLGAGIPLPW